MDEVNRVSRIGNKNAPTENIACNPLIVHAFPGARLLIAVLQKLLVAPLATPVRKNASATHRLLFPKMISRYYNAKKALKNKMLFFRPIATGSSPAAKLEIRLPTECKLTINPQNA